MPKRKNLTPAQKRRLCGKYGWCCAICKEPGEVIEDFEYDHSVPVAMEGGSHEGNYKPLCSGCHGKKTKRDMFNISKLKRLEKARHALEHGIEKPKRKRDKSQWGIPGMKKQIGTGRMVKR